LTMLLCRPSLVIRIQVRPPMPCPFAHSMRRSTSFRPTAGSSLEVVAMSSALTFMHSTLPPLEITLWNIS